MGLFFALPASAQVVVFDPAAQVQTQISAIESVTQTLQQIQEYQTQLTQLEDQMTNASNLSDFQWDNASSTINQLLGKVDTISQYSQSVGGLDQYNNSYQPVDYYRSSPCFNGHGCSQQQLQALTQSESSGSLAQKQANDAMINGIYAQQAQMRSDALRLQELQSAAQGAGGRMQAIQAGNQLASHQSSQLLQIRSLLVQQQQAEVARNQVLANREAIEQASIISAHRGYSNNSSSQVWRIQ